MSDVFYSLSADFPSGLDPGQFDDEIQAAGLSVALVGVSIKGDQVKVEFTSTPSAGDQTTLDGLVAAHVPGTDPPQAESELNNALFSTDGTFVLTTTGDPLLLGG